MRHGAEEMTAPLRAALVALLLGACSASAGNPAAAPDGNVSGNVTGPEAGSRDSAANDGGAPDPEPTFTDAQLATLKGLAPSPLPAPPLDRSNKFGDDPKAALLGQRLFFEPGFAGQLLDGDNDDPVHALGMKGESGKVACAGCHLPKSGYVDTRSIQAQTSLGSGWGMRRAPSLLDVGQSRLIMWDGRHDTLYNQVFGPLESAVEMNSSRLYGAEQIFAHYKADYEAVFGPLPPLGDPAHFPVLTAATTGCRALDMSNKCVGVMRGAPGDGAEFDGLAQADKDAVTRVWVNVGKALAAYERLLRCGPSRFDQWANGDTKALTRAEQRGAALFVGKGKCVSCHSGPYLSDEKFHNVGLKPGMVATVFVDSDDPGASAGLALAQTDPLNVKGMFSDFDDGRLPATLGPELTGAFRTPRLRCISKHPSFMHTGQFRSLDEVVAFFGHGGDEFGYPGTNELQAVGLTPAERADVVAFLTALEGPGPDVRLLTAP
jgi:cytochrome c peroxidase